MTLDLDNSRRSRPAGRSWGQAKRGFAAVGGLVLIAVGARRRGWLGLGLSVAGLGLIARSAAGVPSGRLVSSGNDPYAFEARRAITIRRPVTEVFALLSDYGNYPEFMPTVREMEILPGLRHRWTMVGPGGLGIPVRDAITQLVPDEFVAWESEPGSALCYAGAASFRPLGPDVTRVVARMSYGPPLGAIGDAGARLFGQDPARQLADILGRARQHLESGRFHNHQESTR